jgi:hypothetical protein
VGLKKEKKKKRKRKNLLTLESLGPSFEGKF